MAPVIHEWTYEAMAYDLLDLQDDTFRYTVQTGHGAQEMQALLQVSCSRRLAGTEGSYRGWLLASAILRVGSKASGCDGGGCCSCTHEGGGRLQTEGCHRWLPDHVRLYHKAAGKEKHRSQAPGLRHSNAQLQRCQGTCTTS